MVRTWLRKEKRKWHGSLNPLKAGQWFGHTPRGSPFSAVKSLNPLKAGQWFGPVNRIKEIMSDIKVSIPSKRGNGSDKAVLEYFVDRSGLSQSPQSGAMVRTTCQELLIRTIDQVSIPSKRGNGSDLYKLIETLVSFTVSIPSKRGNGSDSRRRQ